MKAESLGLNHWLSLSASAHTVRPLSSALSSGQRRTAPPKSDSSMLRCRWYHAANAVASPLHFRKTPPIPVTFAITASAPLRRETISPQRDDQRRTLFRIEHRSDARLQVV